MHKFKVSFSKMSVIKNRNGGFICISKRGALS